MGVQLGLLAILVGSVPQGSAPGIRGHAKVAVCPEPAAMTRFAAADEDPRKRCGEKCDVVRLLKISAYSEPHDVLIACCTVLIGTAPCCPGKRLVVTYHWKCEPVDGPCGRKGKCDMLCVPSSDGPCRYVEREVVEMESCTECCIAGCPLGCRQSSPCVRILGHRKYYSSRKCNICSHQCPCVGEDCLFVPNCHPLGWREHFCLKQTKR